MFALHRSLSVGYLRQHPTRAVLIVLSIALGVATLVATRMLNQSVNQSAKESINPLARIADLMVVNAQTGVPRDLARQLKQAHIPGLLDAQPVVLGRVTLPNLDHNGRSVWLFGFDPPKDRTPTGEDASSAIEIEQTATPADYLSLAAGRVPVFVADKLARDLQSSGDGKRFEALASSKNREMVVMGVVRFKDANLLKAGDFILLRVADASTLIFPRRPENVSQINILVQAGADPAQVRRDVQAYVGDQADVRTLEANYQAVRDVTGGLELGFNIGGAGALVVGLFLVYNVLSVSVAERRHDIGILRSVGATRGQVAGLFLGEASLLGLAGSVLGLPLGYGLGWVSLGPLLRVLNDVVVPANSFGLELSPALMLIALAAGLSVSLLAALIPALAAASEEPANAVRRVPLAGRLLARITHLAAVALFLGAGIASVVWRAHLPIRIGVFAGAVLLFLGGLVLIPLVTELLGRLLQPLVRSSLGLEGRLAADNLVRSPARTGIVIAALAATGGLVFHIAGFIYSTKSAVHTWIDQSIAADLFVTCGGSVDEASLTQPMDEHLGEELRRSLTDVEAAVGVRFHFLDFRDRIVILLGVDTDAFPEHTERSLARNLNKYPRLRERNCILVSENFAALYGVGVGDHIAVRGRRGPLELEVIGTMVDYTWNRGTILMARSGYKEVFGDNQVDIYDVYLRPGAAADAVRDELETRWGKSAALYARTRAQLDKSIEIQLDNVYNLAYAQELIVGLVTLLGVVSALFISVLQRRRELGLLRAVGASRGQVLGTVLAEAALMGLIGAFIGFLVGLLLEWYVVYLILFDEAGLVFPMLIPWRAAAFIFGLSLLLATVVGLWPAYHATRLRIAEAIAYE
jgi:putative ABC transport system permease protein